MRRLAVILALLGVTYLVARRRRELYDTWPHVWVERREVEL